ncbi:MAG: hypothetical protein ACAI34_08800 [Verrucomicrobium sp.]
MKTTLDLPDDLLIGTEEFELTLFEIGEHGFLQLKKCGAEVTTEIIEKIREEEGV